MSQMPPPMNPLPALVPEVWIEHGAKQLAAGERLDGRFRVKGWRETRAYACEVSVLWYTAGKGEEDTSVHEFLRYRLPDKDGPSETADRLDPSQPVAFSTRLPYSPLSYDGVIVKVCWCVRLRVLLPRDRSVVCETSFALVGPNDAKGESPSHTADKEAAP
ncbi:hypothetical protein Mal64_03890 [Pseudobythopirellula maris]|uniref:Arrestin-like N-terminal domain-containing protein n=1 Tax=Pseudobythopirellula maris TaxID=2527991 RepID=A0A5C5ZSP4_9BACT|nr:hypothetical protein [Pseudobythopirellula maris]TWT90007.1 hypothetical protein Mal64_03890 [Pseudobythopirellula maris]